VSRTLVVGDVHGCADELAELIRRTSPDRLVLVGDLFTKGPDPRGVWKIIAASSCDAVLGNHDAAVLKQWGGGWKGLPKAARKWLAARPLTLEGPTWTVVHGGLHPTRGAEGTTRKMALNMRRFPDGSKPTHAFWWEGFTSKKVVVYGHDARRGLVDRRPYTLGLDTGCVYGGALTGWLVEEDRLVQVPAARIHFDPLA
jgi:hypothetical protein